MCEVDKEKAKSLHAKSWWREQKEVLLQKAQNIEIFRKNVKSFGRYRFCNDVNFP